MNVEPKDTTASVQGFGNVAQHAIELYTKLGGKVICVSSWDQKDQTSYAFKRNNGVDLQELHSITDKFGGIDKESTQKGYEVLPGKVWIEQDVDILVPAAMENQITGETAPGSARK